MKTSHFWLLMTIAMILPSGLGMIWESDILTIIFSIMGVCFGILWIVYRVRERKEASKRKDDYMEKFLPNDKE